MKTLFENIQNIIRLYFPFISKKKILLAFEYGVILSEVAKEREIELTQDIVIRAEEVIMDAFLRYNEQKVAVDMMPIILSIFETDMGN